MVKWNNRREKKRGVLGAMNLIYVILCYLLTKAESYEPGVCGNRPLVEDFRGPLVVGGKDAEPGNWPWTVSIQKYSDAKYFHYCAGVVLNHLWVLTAAHCFKDLSNEYFSWRLVFGTSQHSDMGIHTQIRTIKRKIQHENYDPKTQRNDIALLRLNQTLVFDEYTQPACLPAKQAILKKLDDCYIAGWGVTKKGSIKPTDILQEASVNLISVERCNRPTWYNGAVSDHNLCAGYEQGGINICQGASGGPLMCRRSNARFYTVVGIASWGSGCGQKQHPGIYTSTQYYLDWITEYISDAKTSTTTEKEERKGFWQNVADKIKAFNSMIGIF